MCGREPNFELTVEEKDELSKLSWDEFLTMTRSAINSKSIFRILSIILQTIFSIIIIIITRKRMVFMIENYSLFIILSEHQRRVSSRMKFEHPSQNGERKAEADQGGNSFSGSDDAETSAS